MPLTTIYDGGTRVIGSGTVISQGLHPTVMEYINIMSSNGGYSMTVNEIDAINNMVWALVSNGIWTKIQAIYPVLGGTAATHKFNLKDPRDVDAAFRLNFVGGWTHNSNGMTPNGTNGYANTFLKINSVTSGHLSSYSRTNSDGLIVDIGSASNGLFYNAILSRFGDIFYGGISQNANFGATCTDSRGMFIVSRTSSTVLSIFRNNILLNSGTLSASAANNFDLFIGAWNNIGIAERFSNRQYAFLSVGDGLTNVEATAFYSIVQAYQQKLGRAV